MNRRDLTDGMTHELADWERDAAARWGDVMIPARDAPQPTWADLTTPVTTEGTFDAGHDPECPHWCCS